MFPRRWLPFRFRSRRPGLTVGVGLGPYRYVDPWYLNAPAPRIPIPRQRRPQDGS